jgi:hypothetical protein
MAEARTWIELFVGGGASAPAMPPTPGETPTAPQNPPSTSPTPATPPENPPTGPEPVPPTGPVAPPSAPPAPTVPPAPPAATGPTVPDVLGLTRADAEAALRRAGYVPHARGDAGDALTDGLVVRQSPQGGTPGRLGARVQLTVVSGPGHDGTTSTVPNLVGRSGPDAVSAALSAGFIPVVVPDRDPRAVAGRVRDQSPALLTAAPTGSHVRVYVGAGFASNEEPVQVPIVVGLSVASRARWWAACPARRRRGGAAPPA